MKNVLILSASPRIGGNSDSLSDEFKKGAEAAGHHVEKVLVSKQNIKYCIGCGTCQRNGGSCIQIDDMAEILTKLKEADVIVMATPVYFYSMNAQLKTLIDRTCPSYMKMQNKDFYILMAAAEDDREMMHHVVESFEGFFACLDEPHLCGVVYGLDAYEIGDIKGKDSMQEAYQMGLHC